MGGTNLYGISLIKFTKDFPFEIFIKGFPLEIRRNEFIWVFLIKFRKNFLYKPFSVYFSKKLREYDRTVWAKIKQ